VSGRVFDARDGVDTPRVAVITETMARRYFGGVNAVGRRFRLARDPASWTDVIGVVRDTGTGSFADDVLDPIAPPFDTSYTQSGELPTTVIARTSADAASLVAAMQREVRALNVTLPVITAMTMAQELERSEAAPAAIAAGLAVLAGLGLDQPVALGGQDVADQLAVLVVVLDDQDQLACHDDLIGIAKVKVEP
jgi:hypothetical protein